jgi:Domain of unknown function (DUF5664)
LSTVPTASGYVMKDSGARETYPSGMIREIQADKVRFDLIIPTDLDYDQTMLYRWAELLARGAEKYYPRNWEKATGQEELDRAKASAFRHFMQWFCGETDEDHAASVYFNIQMAEFVKTRMDSSDVQS